jgi:hypothetical protein
MKSIVVDLPVTVRFSTSVWFSLFFLFRKFKEPEPKRIKIEDSKVEEVKIDPAEGSTSAVVIENGPVQYIQNLKEGKKAIICT